MGKQLSALVLVALVAACSNNTAENEAPPQPTRVCTMIGCENGLAVEVKTALQQAFTVNVRSGTKVHTFRCEPRQTCRTFISNETPAEVLVTVETARGPVSQRLYPQYRMNRPNGPDCPPECKQATVTFEIN